MKSFVRHHLLLLHLLSSCLLFSPSPAASQDETVILDSDGRPVIGGEPYYVATPSKKYSLGTTSPNGDCPLNVFLKTGSYGPPVMLFPEVHPNIGNVHPDVVTFVHVNRSVAVMFASVPPSPCEYSTQWRVNPITELVTTGGALSNSLIDFRRFWVVPSDNIILGAGPRYYFWSCPSPSIKCQKLGVVGDDKLLGVSKEPLEIQFIRVPKEPPGSAAALHSTA